MPTTALAVYKPRSTLARRSRRRTTYRGSKNFRRKVQNVILSTAEKKTFIISAEDAAVSSTMSTFSLTPLAEGTDSDDREGNEVYPLYLSIHGYMRGSDSYNFMRLLLIQWFPDSLIDTPGAGEIFQSTVDQHHQMFGPLNTLAVNKKFRVLWTKRIQLVNDATAIGELGRNKFFNVNINCRKKLKYKKIIFDGTGTIDGRGKLYLLAVSDSTVTSHPLISMVSKLSFRDP